MPRDNKQGLTFRRGLPYSWQGPPRYLKAISGDLRHFLFTSLTPLYVNIRLTIVPSKWPNWDTEFFDAFRRGEEIAFDWIFRHYHGPLTYYAFEFVGDRAIAKDMVQDCFVKLWQHRRRCAHINDIRAYLYTSVRHCCIDWLKSRKKEIPLPAPESYETDSAYLESEVLARVQQAIELLPQRMKQVVTMYYLEDKSLEEIGLVIGIDPETARSHRYRGIQFIKKTIIASGATLDDSNQ